VDSNPNEQRAGRKTPASFARVLLVAPAVTFGFTIATLVALMTFVPRRADNIRSVPDVAWPTYAAIGNFAPLLLSLIVLTLLFRKPNRRIVAWAIAVLVCYVAHVFFVSDLLHRDYVGKF